MAQPPSVTIGTATTKSADGTVNPNGSQTTYVQWGMTTAYGSSSAPTSAGSGTFALPVAKTVKGLKKTTYHFRLVGTSAAGTTFGADVAFTIK